VTPLKFKTVTELQQQATQIEAEVERTGKQVIITKNGKPVVVIQRVTEEEMNLDKPKKIREDHMKKKNLKSKAEFPVRSRWDAEKAVDEIKKRCKRGGYFAADLRYYGLT
jgi:prevent-host-death family protein